MRLLRAKLLCPLILAVLVGCAGEGNKPGPGPGPDPSPGLGPNPNPPSGQCANLVREAVTVPTRAVNGPATCDYLVERSIDIRSTLTIDPGTVIRFAKDSGLRIEGGELLAVGRPDARITLEGQSPIQGFWRGITLSTRAGKVDLQYLDLKDAGQVCAVEYCPDGAIVGFGGGQLTLKHSTISNSYVNGANLGTELVAFANNRFFGNRWYGLVIDADKVPLLDKASDYLGGNQPNGKPYIALGIGTAVSRASTWKRLNAPYHISGYIKVEDTLTLEPGVKFMSDGGWISVEPGGTLIAVGTAADPIEFTGVRPEPGVWDGIYFSVGNTGRDNRLEYVKISYGGGQPRELVTNGLITNYSAGIYVANSVFQHSSRWAFSCTDENRALIRLGPGNAFSNNAFGDIDPDCNPTQAP